MSHLLVNLHTVLLSVMTLTMAPGPAVSTSFSCQLNSTLIPWPPLSAPTERECIWENPVGCGDIALPEEPCVPCDIPLYLVQSVRVSL